MISSEQSIYGLNLLKFSKDKVLRVGCVPTFKVGVMGQFLAFHSWDDTPTGDFWEARMALATLPTDDRIQTGTLYDQLPNGGTSQYSQSIEFPKAYADTPTVVAWFILLEADHKYTVRAEVSIDSTDETSFTLAVSTSNNSILRNFGIQWLAFPSEAANHSVSSYTASFRKVGSWEPGTDRNPYYTTSSQRLKLDPIDLDPGRLPDVFLAFRVLELSNQGPFSAQVSTRALSRKGFSVDFDCLNDATVEEAEVQVVVFPRGR